MDKLIIENLGEYPVPYVPIPLAKYAKQTKLSTLQEVLMLINVYRYTHTEYKWVCYYMSYFWESASVVKREFLRKQTNKLRIAHLLSLKHNIKEAWRFGYIDDHEYINLTTFLAHLVRAVAHLPITNFILNKLYGKD